MHTPLYRSRHLRWIWGSHWRYNICRKTSSARFFSADGGKLCFAILPNHSLSYDLLLGVYSQITACNRQGLEFPQETRQFASIWRYLGERCDAKLQHKTEREDARPREGHLPQSNEFQGRCYTGSCVNRTGLTWTNLTSSDSSLWSLATNLNINALWTRRVGRVQSES